MERLSTAAGLAHLRIHCYRALLERVIAEHFPGHRRSELAKVRHFHLLSFGEYVAKATSRLPIHLTEQMLETEANRRRLADYMRVVIFYTLRLHLAPLLESFVNLDRMLYLFEEARIRTALVPLFDPLQSPRNFVLIAHR